jgi:hypothetical protein
VAGIADGCLRGGTLRPPLADLARVHRKRALWLLAATWLVFGLAALPSLETMSDHGTGVIELELMRTTGKAQEVLSDYGAEGRSAARTSLWLDYPYLVSYALFLSLACAGISERARRLGRFRWAAVGVALAWAAVLAGLFDAVENAALLRVLAGHPEQPYPAIAYLCAVPKFVLSAAALLYAVTGLLALRGSGAPETSDSTEG